MKKTSKILIDELSEDEKVNFYARIASCLLVGRGDEVAGNLAGIVEDFEGPEDQPIKQILVSNGYLSEKNGKYAWTAKAEKIYRSSFFDVN